MVMVSMITRLCRSSALVAVVAGAALLLVGCQKVPLLAPSGSTIQLTALATVLPTNGSTDVIATRSEHQDGYARLCPNASQYVEAIDPGQHHIQNNQRVFVR